MAKTGKKTYENDVFEDNYRKFLNKSRNSAGISRSRSGAYSGGYVGGGYTGAGFVPQATRESTLRKEAVEYAEPVEELAPRKKPAHKQSPAAKTRQKVYVKAKNGIKLFTLPVLLLFLVIFGGMFAVGLTFAVEAGLGDDYKVKSAELEKLRASNYNLEHEGIIEEYSLAEIRERALALGMHEPLEYQKVYVDGSDTSYVVQYDEETEPVDSGVGVLVNSIEKIFQN